jgi:hypothetical protein
MNKYSNKISITVLYLFILIILHVSACSEDETILDTKEGTPEFVVNSLYIKGTVKNNPNKNKTQTYLTTSIRYHFENCSGSATWYTFKFFGYDNQFEIEFYPGSPSPADTIYSWNWDYWIDNDFSGKDYITINVNITGGMIFSQSNITYSRSFIWNKDIRAVIYR